MAKFGLFTGPHQVPTQEYQGDYMTQQGEFVMIFKTAQGIESDRQVAAIRLDKNQSVREL